MNRGLLRTTLAVGLLGAILSLHSAGATPGIVPLPPATNRDGRSGVCYSFYPGAENRPYLPLVKQAGSGWDRFDFSWPSIEPSQGEWRFEAHDTLVYDLGEFDVDSIGILLWTPDWASTGTQSQEPQMEPVGKPTDWLAPSLLYSQARSRLAASAPKGLYEEWDDWTETDDDPINYWGRYVHEVVSRYSDPSRFRNPVKHWEMWNEVDDGAWNYFWTGTEEDYARLLEVGYLATKDACPDCTVLYAGLLYWADQTHFERVLDILKERPQAANHNFYFDAMSVHLYSRSSTVYDTIERIRSRMKALVPDRPIWLTETGVMVWDDDVVDPDPTKYDFAATQQEAASYVIQSYANGWASGVERYLFFRANDQDLNDYFGLMRNDRSFRPSYVAYQVATRYLISPTLITHWSYSNGIRRVTLWGTPHGKISVLWNQLPEEQDFSYPAVLSTATLVDQRGNTQTIGANYQGYELTFPAATANLVSDPDDYIVGGEPYLVIEEDTVPPGKAAIAPLPPTTYSDTIWISWSAVDHQAGVWGAEMQVRQGEDEAWSSWLEVRDTADARAARYEAAQHNTRYCFRARAWDRAGNPGAWSTSERCTQVDLDRDVQIVLGPVFGDESGDGIWDVEQEEPLTGVGFQLVDEQGAQIAASCGPSWETQTTLRIGNYALRIVPESWPSAPPGWLPRQIALAVKGGELPLTIQESPLGLLPHRSSSHLPLILLTN